MSESKTRLRRRLRDAERVVKAARYVARHFVDVASEGGVADFDQPVLAVLRAEVDTYDRGARGSGKIGCYGEGQQLPPATTPPTSRGRVTLDAGRW